MSHGSGPDDDVVSEAGADDVFRAGASAAPVGVQGFTRTAPVVAPGFGRGPIRADPRKFRYDVSAALVKGGAVKFTATKVDRLDAMQAGDILHRIHQVYSMHNETEERIYAFDQALWYEHAVNGGSTLHPERGTLVVGEVEFDIAPIRKLLGVDARRFFRAYADDIATCLRRVMAAYDPYDPVSVEMHGAIMQVAVARGLQKYPHLIHDSSDAGLNMSIEERAAVLSSKRYVIEATVNSADAFVGRVGSVTQHGSPAAVKAVN